MWNTTLISPNKNHGVQKNNLYEKKKISADYVKIIELHVTCNLRRWNNRGNYIDQKDQSKLNILKNSFFKYIWHKF